MIWLCRLGLILMILLTPLIGTGQTKEDSVYTAGEILVTSQRYDIPTVSTVATRVPVPLQTTPASVSVVTQSQLEEQGSIVLSDALHSVSGANVQTNFGVHDFFLIRGFESLTGGLVVTDGVSEPEATYYNLYNVDRVEVLKGPGAFLYGGSPLSGTVSLSRKQPVFKKFMRLDGAFGQFGTTRGNLDLALAGEEANMALRLNALAQRSDSYRDDKGNSVYAVNPAYTWKPTDASMLTFNMEYVDNRYKSDSGLPIVENALADVPRTRSYQAPFDISDQEIVRLRLDYQNEITPNLTLRNKAYYTNFSWKSKGTLFNGVMPTAPGDGELFRLLMVLDDRQKVLGNQADVAMSFATGKFRHNLLTGFEVIRWLDAFTLDIAALPNINLQHPVETATEPLFFIPGQSTAADARSRILAPYVIDRIVLSNNYQVFLGGRFDFIDYEDPITSTKREYRQFSPMAGLVYNPLPALTFYASTGGAFAAPSSRVAGASGAEESTQYETGVKKQLLDGRLQANAAVYWLGKENIAIPTADGFTAQIGDQRSRGVELELMAQPMDAWTTFIAYAYLDAVLTRFSEQVYVPTPRGIVSQVVDHSGNTPAFAPAHLFNLWTSYHWRNGLGFGVGVRFTGSQFISEDNAYKINGALTCSAAVFYTFDQWHVRLNLRNLTNTRYETRGFGARSAMPAQPFSAYVSVGCSL